MVKFSDVDMQNQVNIVSLEKSFEYAVLATCHDLFK